MTNTEAFSLLRGAIAVLGLSSNDREFLLSYVDDAYDTANDNVADAFAEGRYATIEPVVRPLDPEIDMLTGYEASKL